MVSRAVRSALNPVAMSARSCTARPRSSFRANRNALAAGAQGNARRSSLQLSRPELLVAEVTRQFDVCMHALSASASSGCRACRRAQLSSLRKSVSWRLPRNITCLLHVRRAGLLAHASNSKEAPSAGQAFHRRRCQGAPDPSGHCRDSRAARCHSRFRRLSAAARNLNAKPTILALHAGSAPG